MKTHSQIMIDLHGLSVKETKAVLENCFSQINELKIKEFYIITGRGKHINSNGGRAVLKNILPKLLKPYCDEILEINKEVGSYKVSLKKNSLGNCNHLKQALSIMLGNEEEQFHYYKALEIHAGKGNATALYKVAIIYLFALVKGFDNKKRAIELLKRAKHLGLLDAYSLLGECFLEGIGVEKNYEKAIKYIQYAALHHHASSQFLLGKCYMLGQGIKRSDNEAIHWLKKSADQGYVDGLFNMGIIYFNGEIVKENDTLAAYYLTGAAERGHLQAMVYLARCYACGYGLKQSYEKAFYFYQVAAEHNDTYALHMVAQYYWEGRCVKQSYEKAFMYLLRGAELEDGDCQAKVGEAYCYGLGVKQDFRLGLGWIEKAIIQKNPFAYYVKAQLYCRGIGVEKNFYQHEIYLKMAAEKGFAPAKEELLRKSRWTNCASFWKPALIVGALITTAIAMEQVRNHYL